MYRTIIILIGLIYIGGGCGPNQPRYKRSNDGTIPTKVEALEGSQDQMERRLNELAPGLLQQSPEVRKMIQKAAEPTVILTKKSFYEWLALMGKVYKEETGEDQPPTDDIIAIMQERKWLEIKGESYIMWKSIYERPVTMKKK